MTAELVCLADDPRWLAERRTGVTATDVPAILGISPWDSLYSCWWRKQGGYDDPGESERMALGRYLEAYVVGRWEDAQDDYRGVTRPAGLYRSEARPWQLATPDRLTGPAREPLECKSWGTADGWGPDGSDVMPVHVRAQVLWQMDVLGAAAGHVAVVFLPSGEFRSYRIGHDPVPHGPLGYELEDDACRACEDIAVMQQAGREFWWTVKEMRPPSPDGSAASLAVLKARFASPDKHAEAEIPAEMWQPWQDWKQAAKAAESMVKQIEAQMRELAGDAGIYVDHNGQPFARRERFTAHVKAHDRTTDRLMPVKPKEGHDDAPD